MAQSCGSSWLQFWMHCECTPGSSPCLTLQDSSKVINLILHSLFSALNAIFNIVNSSCILIVVNFKCGLSMDSHWSWNVVGSEAHLLTHSWTLMELRKNITLKAMDPSQHCFNGRYLMDIQTNSCLERPIAKGIRQGKTFCRGSGIHHCPGFSVRVCFYSICQLGCKANLVSKAHDALFKDQDSLYCLHCEQNELLLELYKRRGHTVTVFLKFNFNNVQGAYALLLLISVFAFFFLILWLQQRSHSKSGVMWILLAVSLWLGLGGKWIPGHFILIKNDWNTGNYSHCKLLRTSLYWQGPKQSMTNWAPFKDGLWLANCLADDTSPCFAGPNISLYGRYSGFFRWVLEANYNTASSGKLSTADVIH